ncbi:BQ2448_7539 [Microbotryum intermedium]|uniref:BQ2448_7539 protein n=1 Tax=Microbotryum intermedium TaxID=269621 RepID=A0A238FL53_9BASI|nr:BQ2448_7539 [Microbotryum intermedium]
MSGSPAETAADARALESLVNNAVASELRSEPFTTTAPTAATAATETTTVETNPSGAGSEEDAPFEPDTDPIPSSTTAAAAAAAAEPVTIESKPTTKSTEDEATVTESIERGPTVTTVAPTVAVAPSEPEANALTSAFAPPAPAPAPVHASSSTSNVSESIAGSRPRRVSVLSTHSEAASDQRSVVKWTPADDRKLDEAFAKYGPSWDAVAAAVGNGRTNRSCKERLGRRQRSNDPTVSMAPLTVAPRRASIDGGLGDRPDNEHVFNRRPSPFADAEGEDDPMVGDAQPPLPPVAAAPAPVAVPVANPSSNARPKIIGKKLGKSRPSTTKLVPAAAAAAVERPPASAAPPVDNPLVYSAATADRTLTANGVSATTARILSEVDDKLRAAGIGGRIPGRTVPAAATGDVKPDISSGDAPVSPSTSASTLAPSAGHNIALTTPFNKNTVIRGRRTMAANEMEGKLLSKTGKIKKVHICPADSCEAAFKRSEHLKRHYKAVHIGAKPFPCDAEGCDKTFSRKDNLHQHMIFVHSLKPVREYGIQFLDELMPAPAPAPAPVPVPEVAVAAPAAPVEVAATASTSIASVLAPAASISNAPTTPRVAEGSVGSATGEQSPAALANSGQFASSRGRVPAPIRYEPIAEEDKNRRRKIVRRMSPGGTFTEEHLPSPGARAASSSPLAADARPKQEPIEQSLPAEAASPVPHAVKESNDGVAPGIVSPVAVAPETPSTSSTPSVLAPVSASTHPDDEPANTVARTSSTSSRAKPARGGGLGARFRQGRGGSIAAAAAAVASSPSTTAKRPVHVPSASPPTAETLSNGNGHTARPKEHHVEDVAMKGEAQPLGFAPPRASIVTAGTKHARDEGDVDAQADEASASKRAKEAELGPEPASA